MRGLVWVVLALVCAGVLGCTHDLDALRSGVGKTNSNKLRDAGKPTTLSEPDAGDAGTDAGSGGSLSPSACEPCPAVPDAGPTVALRTCCRLRECGITFGVGGMCLQRDVPGQLDAGCPSVSLRTTSLDGCCRPDGRCGLTVPNLELGCGARDELPAALNIPMAAAKACKFDCTVDSDCTAPGYLCVQDPIAVKRQVCTKSCQHDQGCPTDQICSIKYDFQMTRNVTICRPPVGSARPGDPCSSFSDCVSGLCNNPGYCTTPCVTKSDCPTSSYACTALAIADAGPDQTFKVCVRPN